MPEVTMLQTVWFVLWGLLWAMYFVLDGFDLGMGSLMPFIAKNETEKRIMYNAAGPFWDGNEVWLIAAGGVTFAAFPKAYAIMFSALYAPLLLLLFALIFRGVTFEYRNKIDSAKWRKFFDISHVLGSFLPALLLGVAFANLFMGIPIDAKGIYHGNILKLLNPYGLLGGILFVLMFCYHGALWLSFKTVGELHDRAVKYSQTIWLYLVAVAVAFLVATYVFTPVYNNIFAMPVLAAFPILAVVFLLTSRFAGGGFISWAFNGGFIICATFFGVLGMFPNLIPSNYMVAEGYNTAASIALNNGGSSSELTLTIMLVVALTFVPVILAYQAWVYYTFSHKVTEEELKKEHAY